LPVGEEANNHENWKTSRVGTPSPGLQSNRVPVDKSPVLAFILTFFLGPLGLLYVKVMPALLLFLVALTGYFTFWVTTAVAWIVSIVWACVEASRRHRASESWRASTGDQGIPVPGYQQTAALAYYPGQDAPLPPPGWYPDAVDATKVRWWDGSHWTGDAQPASQLPPPGTARPDLRFPPPAG
jgi:hypothetical protein